MAQAGDNMAAYRIPANAGNSIPTQPIIQNLQPRDTPNDVVPPSDKEPKSKDKSKHKRKHQDHKYSGEPSNHKGSKKMKQKILEFPISYSLANISAITNSGFFTNDFYPNHIIKLDSISNLEHHVLNKNDDFVNQDNLWAFHLRATAIVQHIVGSCNVIKLKSNLKNVKSSLNSALTAHVALAGDNVTLKEKVSKLKDMTKGLED